jgi:WD40 repeat protein
MVFFKKFEFNDHTGPVYSIASAGHFIYSSGADKWIARWNVLSQKQDEFAIKLESTAYSIFHSANQPLLYVGCSNGDFHVINTISKEEIKFIKHHKSAIFSIQENHLTNQIYTGDSAGNFCIWDRTTFQLELQIPLNCEKIRAIELIDQGNKIVVVSKDGKLRFFETSYYNELLSVPINTDGLQSLLTITDSYLVGGHDGYLYLVDSITNSVLSKIAAHRGAIYSIEQINENYFATSSRDKTVKIWKKKTMKVIQKLDLKVGGHKNSVNDILLLKNDLLVSCSDDSKIIGWKLNDLESPVII